MMNVYPIFFSYAFPKTNSSPLNIGLPPQKKGSFPNLHFGTGALLVPGSVW